MPEKLKEGYLATLGIAAITYEKAVEISKKLIKQGELAKDKQKKFVENLIQESKKNVAEMTSLLNEKVEELAKKGEPLKAKQDVLLKSLTEKAKEASDITGSKIKDLVKDAKQKTRSVTDKIAGDDAEKIKKVLDEMDIPTREDLEEIRDKLDDLISRLDGKDQDSQE
jgi:polyhydroxyalkanoate synthesis regulator phasin